MSVFAERVEAFLAEYFRLHPLRATDVGEHAYDDRWPDLTERGRAERLDFYDRWAAELGAMPDESLDRDERIDRDLLTLELAAHRFAEVELDELAWDVVAWAYLLGDGIFPLLAREFAPLPVRLASVAARLETMPAVVDAAIASLVGSGGRPVPALHAETALGQLPGITELAMDAVAQAEAATADPEVADLLPRLRAAAELAAASVSRLEAHIRDVVIPAAEGDGRLGRELFEAKLGHTLMDPELPLERVLQRAEREYATVRAEMIRLAGQLWQAMRPGEPRPTAESEGSQAAADQRTVRLVLDAIAREHPAAEDLLEHCREELGRIEAFVRERDLIPLPEEPLDIRWTPVFLRSFGGAMLIPPGPLDRGQRSYFAITPAPEDWTPERVESSLRESNDRQLRLLTIHEAVPGHYLQLAYSNRCPSLVRAIFGSGVFIEGWAVYVTQVMMDVGYGAEDPALMLAHWKFYLRGVINALIDARIHAYGMTEDEAVTLMVEGGFQEEAEARNKYKRARLTSAQLSTYFVGSLAWWDIELERRRRDAEAAGVPDPQAAVPDPPLVGGFGETPGFSYPRFLVEALDHGSPPTSLLRRIMFEG
ncbi:MAG TPA: DUF885 domain-containing protein [Candidatus Dormibacteraeota bacterium]|nr:DUF885 domain-containing protein [Candidatus Dormibacteraeota bacterium]